MALAVACAARPSACTATLQALPRRHRPFAAAAAIALSLPRLQPAGRLYSASRPSLVVCQAEQEDGVAGEGGESSAGHMHRRACANPMCKSEASRLWYSAPAESGLAGVICLRCYAYQRRTGRLPAFPSGGAAAARHGPCCNPCCGATGTAAQWHRAPEGSSVEGSICTRCYAYFKYHNRLPSFPKVEMAHRSDKLHGPCANPACQVTETGQWFSAPNGLEGAICRRCHIFQCKNGRLPDFPKGSRNGPVPRLHGPCTNPACGRADSQLWYSAPPGAEHQGAICQRCYMYARRRGVLPAFATGAKAVRHGPCSNPECGASESHRWHAAPPSCGLDGAICSKCKDYLTYHGRLPAFAQRRHAVEAALARAAAADPPLLTEREVRVLRLRHGLEGGRDATLTEVGRALGLSRERARQIQAEAMEKLAALPPE